MKTTTMKNVKTIFDI